MSRPSMQQNNTMNIFFDARWTRTDVHDGVSRYGASLVEALAQQHPVTMLVHDEAQLALLPDIPYILVNHPLSPKELFIAQRLNALGADVVFTPLQVMGFHGRKYKLIFTLQDLIYYRHPQPPTFLPLHVRAVWRAFHMTYWPQRALLNRADHVATVSHTSKKYIEENRLTKRTVTAVRNAPLALPKIKQSTSPRKDLVYMGSFMPYKNVETLIRGMADLPDYTLHLLSRISPTRKKELQKLIPKNTHVIFHNGVSDEEYHQLLASATALVTASKEEGFGLPLVEAMHIGIPVVCSGIEIFHEVAGEAGLFFHPDAPQEFAANVKQLEKPTLRRAMIQKGKTQAAQFSWGASATKLLEVIKQLLHER